MRTMKRIATNIIRSIKQFNYDKFTNVKPMAYKLHHLLTTYLPTLSLLNVRIVKLLITSVAVLIIVNLVVTYFVLPLFCAYLAA